MFLADKIFYNGNIYTMEQEGSKVSAIAVYDGKIIDAGTDDEMRKIPAREQIDLEQKTVLPGFIDTHCHIAEAAEGQLKVDLSDADTMEAVIEKMTAALSQVENDKWLMGYQISERRIGGMPTRYDLDKISDEIPIFISDNGLHSFAGNSKLLEVTGISKGFCKPGSEFMEADEKGEPTGIFREHGMLPYINEKRPSVFASHEHMLQMLEKKLADWSAYGYTTLHSCDGFSDSEIDKMGTYQELLRRGELNMRIILNQQYSLDNSIGAISGAGNDMVKYGAYKIFTDGSFSGRSALLIDEYSDALGWCGRTAHPFEEYHDAMKKAYEKGYDLAIHVIGDGGMEWVLKVIEEIYDPDRKQQFALIHVSLTNESQWERLSKYPVVIETQPIFLPDMEHSKRFRLGEERGDHLMAYRSWMKHGLIVCGGEDGPIYTSNPFESMYYAITRKIGEGVILNEKECISVYDAVAMYTKNAAYCAHEENIKGTLVPGKAADFIVLSADIFMLAPEDIRNLTVEQTYLAGRRVH